MKSLDNKIIGLYDFIKIPLNQGIFLNPYVVLNCIKKINNRIVP